MKYGFLTLVMASTVALAAEPTKEDRAKMAEHHEKMATCLRSDKSFDECRDEMAKSCKEDGPGSCGMGKEYGRGKGKRAK